MKTAIVTICRFHWLWIPRPWIELPLPIDAPDASFVLPASAAMVFLMRRFQPQAQHAEVGRAARPQCMWRKRFPHRPRQRLTVHIGAIVGESSARPRVQPGLKGNRSGIGQPERWPGNLPEGVIHATLPRQCRFSSRTLFGPDRFSIRLAMILAYMWPTASCLVLEADGSFKHTKAGTDDGFTSPCARRHREAEALPLLARASLALFLTRLHDWLTTPKARCVKEGSAGVLASALPSPVPSAPKCLRTRDFVNLKTCRDFSPTCFRNPSGCGAILRALARPRRKLRREGGNDQQPHELRR